ncbi:MAG: LD-carboxypeptidase [Clostridia bacterium]|jgi:muramoyltetrapeptide carboxypeptidase|nr:LD-carboxypeptidase [Clostridia bacterium]
MKPHTLKYGDIIGVIAQSEPILDENLEDIERAKAMLEGIGFSVKFGKHVYENTTNYGATARAKAEDINEMFKDKEVKAIFCAMGGFNCNGVFDYLDFDLIKANPKIIMGYSDPTSLINCIYAKTGLVTFHGPNFKSFADLETSYGFEEMKKRFLEEDLLLGKSKNEYRVIKSGVAEGVLVRR